MTTNYLTERAHHIARITKGDANKNTSLYLCYALLSYSKGLATTLEDVHHAWSAWTNLEGRSDHPSIIPFDQLTLEKQELDRPYMEAIHLASTPL